MSSVTKDWRPNAEERGLLQEENGQIEYTPHQKPRSIKSLSQLGLYSPTLWMFTTLVLAASNVYMFFNPGAYCKDSSLPWAMPTELSSARSAVSVNTIKFTGGVTFDVNGTESMRASPDGLEYVGEPDNDLDQRWRDLEEGRYFLLSKTEAKQAWGSNYKDFYNSYAGGYLATLEVYHLIHCLDHIRQSFYPDRYIHEGIHGEMHRDHCVNSLRQSLMCHADLTPVPTRHYPQVKSVFHYIDSDVVHTCRDYRKIREWTWERTNGKLRVHRDGEDTQEHIRT